MTNMPGLNPQKVFDYENVPGFRFQKAPDQNAPPPAQPGRPTPPVRSGRP